MTICQMDSFALHVGIIELQNPLVKFAALNNPQLPFNRVATVSDSCLMLFKPCQQCIDFASRKPWQDLRAKSVCRLPVGCLLYGFLRGLVGVVSVVHN